MIPKDQIELVERTADIVRIAGAYTSLTPSGSSFKGLCPFHKEKTPSFVVSPAKNRYHCYGCGRSGGPISFLMESERYGFTEAVEKLAEEYGVRLNRSAGKIKKDSFEDEFQKCLLNACQIFSDRLASEKQAQGYLGERGFGESTAKNFELGFAPDSWDYLHGILKKAGFSGEIQLKCGLVREKKNGGYYDFLRNRIIFPIRNETGKYLGFAGRLLSGEGAKYVNPPETEIYKKNSVFYGLNLAAPAIRKKNRVIVVEGYFDVIRLHANHFVESVACCGTALTEEHLRKLRPYRAGQLVLLFDGDKAGMEAALKTSKMCLTKGFEGSACLLPKGMDPDDFLRKHAPEELETLIGDAPNFTRFILDRAKNQAENGGLETQREVVQSLLEIGSGIEGKIRKELWQNAVSKAFNLSAAAIETAPKPKPEYNTIQEEIQAGLGLENFKRDEKLYPAEFRILRLLVLYPSFINLARDFCDPEVFTAPYQKNLAAKLFNLERGECESIDTETLADSFPESRHLLYYLFETASRHMTANFTEEDFKSHLGGFLKRKFAEQRRKDLARATETAAREGLVFWKQKMESLKHLNVLQEIQS